MPTIWFGRGSPYITWPATSPDHNTINIDDQIVRQIGVTLYCGNLLIPVTLFLMFGSAPVVPWLSYAPLDPRFHGAMSKVSGEFKLDRSTVSRWAKGGCVSIDNGPRSGRPRTSTGERSVKLVADGLEEDLYSRVNRSTLIEP